MRPEGSTLNEFAKRFRAVESAAPEWLKPILRMARATGMRLKEVVSLAWADVDRNSVVVHVPEEAKNGSQDIPMSETVREITTFAQLT